MGLITHPSPDPCIACFVGVATSGIQKEDGVLSPLENHIPGRLHLPERESDVNEFQWLHVLTSVENSGLPDSWELVQMQGRAANSSAACTFFGPVRSLTELLNEPSLLLCCNGLCSGSTGKGQRDVFWASSRRLTSYLLFCLVSSLISFYPRVSRNPLDGGLMTLGM